VYQFNSIRHSASKRKVVCLLVGLLSVLRTGCWLLAACCWPLLSISIAVSISISIECKQRRGTQIDWSDQQIDGMFAPEALSCSLVCLVVVLVPIPVVAITICGFLLGRLSLAGSLLAQKRCPQANTKPASQAGPPQAKGRQLKGLFGHIFGQKIISLPT